MIIGDDIDLFGGRISTVSTHGFCCQIETAGERLQLAPATVIHDLLHLNGDNSARPMAGLLHKMTGSAGGLLTRHQAIVQFLDLLAKSDPGLPLATALEFAGREFSQFGEWKWFEGCAPDFGSRHRGQPFLGRSQNQPAWPAWVGTSLPYAGAREYRGHQSYMDSPLAD